jgi:hypothetical protein
MAEPGDTTDEGGIKISQLGRVTRTVFTDSGPIKLAFGEFQAKLLGRLDPWFAVLDCKKV